MILEFDLVSILLARPLNWASDQYQLKKKRRIVIKQPEPSCLNKLMFLVNFDFWVVFWDELSPRIGKLFFMQILIPWLGRTTNTVFGHHSGAITGHNMELLDSVRPDCTSFHHQGTLSRETARGRYHHSPFLHWQWSDEFTSSFFWEGLVGLP